MSDAPAITNVEAATVTEYSEFIPLPPGLLNKPIADWQLDGVTVVVVVMVMGRIWKAWTDGGGLRGIWTAFYKGSAATEAQDVTKPKPQPTTIREQGTQATDDRTTQ